MNPGYAFRDVDSVLRITLSGVFDQSNAEALEKEVEGRTSMPARVIVDMSDMDDCSIFARSVLIRVHKLLVQKGARVVYLGNKPRFRGLALFVCHVAEDPLGRVAVSEEQIDSMFSGAPRLDDAQSRSAAAQVAVKSGGTR